jgi:hypothetical protein
LSRALKYIRILQECKRKAGVPNPAVFIPVEASLSVEEQRNVVGILIASRVQAEAYPLSFLSFLL